MTTRTRLTQHRDGVYLVCDELNCIWNFPGERSAGEAELALVMLLTWWDEVRPFGRLQPGDFEYMVKFVMRAYEQPLAGRMFDEIIIDELPRWVPTVHEGGQS